ncbi:hypothetical protein EDEG_03518 [Edhazardia aedis USNM 41457]|uniref:Uncharacterized protein n=1 Tax=Edhazardia aedis (strain USNM 41457) TaxID=1003232 RepID=J9D390_EDHAE|nr:hypothetical protein EDEG_03518 [Edhazardia aedis USNM 41457]|eukprot:EJW02034.1 hypothetical protein EDEG_03518 [Edhazardia aedis USNM 41457]
MFFDLFKKKKSEKEVDRDLRRVIRKTERETTKLSSEINKEIKNLEKLLKNANKNKLQILDNEIKRISKKIILLQRRRDKNDSRIERIETIRDSLKETQLYSEMNLNDAERILKSQVKVMEVSKKSLKNIDESILMTDVLKEEMEEDCVDDYEIELLAQKLVDRTRETVNEI